MFYCSTSIKECKYNMEEVKKEKREDTPRTSIVVQYNNNTAILVYIYTTYGYE